MGAERAPSREKKEKKVGEGRNQTHRLADLEPLHNHIANVIVHRNALDLVDRELHSDSKSCECECCFFEKNGIKYFNDHNDKLGNSNNCVL